MNYQSKIIILVLFVIAGFQVGKDVCHLLNSNGARHEPRVSWVIMWWNSFFSANSLKCKKCTACDGKNESDDTCGTGLTHCYNTTVVSKATSTTVTARSCLVLPSGTSEGCKTGSVGSGNAEVTTTTCYCKTDLCNMVWDISNTSTIMEMKLWYDYQVEVTYWG